MTVVRLAGRSAQLVSRRHLLIGAGCTTVIVLSGCATSIDPERLGEARSAWERRRADTEPGGTINVTVGGVVVGKGPVHVDLYDAGSDFPREGEQLSSAVVAADEATVVARFDRIPLGSYAIAVFQDLNANGRRDNSFVSGGEPVRYSSATSGGQAGSPSFNDAAFAVGMSPVTLVINLAA